MEFIKNINFNYINTIKDNNAVNTYKIKEDNIYEADNSSTEESDTTKLFNFMVLSCTLLAILFLLFIIYVIIQNGERRTKII